MEKKQESPSEIGAIKAANIGEKLRGFFMDKSGVMFLLFAMSVVIHAILAIQMELPAVNPDEMGVASIAVFYTGGDWSEIMSAIGYYYGYVQAIFYIPLRLIISNPYALYKAMLIVNGIIISFIPMIAYHLTEKIGVSRIWQRITIALCCGFYTSYTAHSKFIWNEAIASLLPWLLVWCLFMAWDRKSRHSRFTFSILTAFLCAVCYGAHSRLIAVVIAFVLTLLIARIFFKKSVVNLPIFFVTLGVSFVCENMFRQMIIDNVWGGSISENSVESGVGRLSGLFSAEGVNHLFATLFGHLYTFITSTAGLGIIAIVVFITIIATRIIEWRKKRKEIKSGGSDAEPAHAHSLKLVVFSIYTALAVGGSLMLSVLFKFNSDLLESVKDLSMFGRYTDNVAPLAIFLALIYLFNHGWSLKTGIFSALAYGYVCYGFATMTFPIIDGARTYRESPVIGLQPLRITEDITSKFTAQSFVIMSSVVFAVLALIIVFTTCSKHYKTHLSAALYLLTAAYTTVYIGAVYLPMRVDKNIANITPAKAVVAQLYNDPQSPQIVAYKTGSRVAALVQFLLPEIDVAYVRSSKGVPENCILFAEKDIGLPMTADKYEVVGETDKYKIYACGDGAKDYIRFKHSTDTQSAAVLTEGQNGF